MRILISHFSALGAVGGVETVVRQLATGLTELGASVGVVETDGRRSGWELSPGIPVHSFTSPTLPSPRNPRGWASVTRSAWQLRRIVDAFRPDVVNVHYPTGQAAPWALAATLPRSWCVVPTLHNSDIRVAPKLVPELAPWQRRLFRQAATVTMVSSTLLREAVTQYPDLAGKAQVIHNGVEPFWFETPAEGAVPRPAQPFVLCAGRYHPQKGLDILLHAWAGIRNELPGTVLWLVGDGPEEAALKQLAAELGLGESVLFSGFVSRDHLRVLHAQAELVVLPSRYEGFPITLLEAGARSAVCVAADVSGVGEILDDGVTGFVVAPESPAALAAGILKAVRLGGDDRRRIGAALQRKVRNRFRIDVIGREYLQAFSAARRTGSRRWGIASRQGTVGA